MTLAAVLWDMDGLLVDTEPVWTVAEEELATQLGGLWSDELKARIAGTRLDVAVPLILGHYGHEPTATAIAEASAWLMDRMVDLYATSVKVLPGALDLLAAVEAAGVPQALVSSSYRALVDSVLTHGFEPFVLTLAGDEVVHGKPHPEPYLTASSRLGTDPRDCVVLEDSSAGVQAAEAAGCAVVAVPTVEGVSFAPGPRRAVRTSLTGLTVDDLERLAAR